MTHSRTKSTTGNNGFLDGRTLYVPRLSIDGASALAAAYRSVGFNAQLVPASDTHSIALARQYTLGEECYPQIVTLGSFLKIIEDPDFDAQKTAFLMPTTNGPCRFGQYRPLIEKILHDRGLGEIPVISPSSVDGYDEIGDRGSDLLRIGWWAIVCSDALRKLLLQTRPYESNAGETDHIHTKSLNILCNVLEKQDVSIQDKFKQLVKAMNEIAYTFSKIPADYSNSKPLIGVVGEIYCRMDEYANAGFIKKIEKFGGEVWLAPVSEWVWYTNFYQKQQLNLKRRFFSKAMLKILIKNHIQLKDEHKLLHPLHHRFKGYEESATIRELLNLAQPYLPHWGVVGEMLLNIGGAIHLYAKGADAIVDISPFTCMNGIVCEAIYPHVSSDCDNLPVKNFYFDENEEDIESDIEIFLELAKTYQKRKKTERVYPEHFNF